MDRVGTLTSTRQGDDLATFDIGPVSPAPDGGKGNVRATNEESPAAQGVNASPKDSDLTKVRNLIPTLTGALMGEVTWHHN